MDAPKPALKRPSALPRPGSRLPAPKTRPSSSTRRAAPPQQPPPSDVSIPAVPPPKGTIGTTSRLTKRLSTSSLSRAAQSDAKPAAAPTKPVASRTNLPAAGSSSRYGIKPAIGGTSASRVKPPLNTKSSIASLRPPVNGGDDEHNDRLGSLGSFRAASRQASRQGYRGETFEEAIAEPQEYVEPDHDVPPVPQRKTSRPSLSERTIESLQSLPSTPKERRRSSFFNPVESPMAPPLPPPGSSLSRNGSNGSRPGTSDGTFGGPNIKPTSPSKKPPASAQPASRVGSRLPSFGSAAATRRSVSGSFASRLQGAKPAGTPRASSPPKQAIAAASNVKAPIGNRTIATSRPSKPKPALGDAFKSPAKRLTVDTTKPAVAPSEPKRVVSNSSAALREQIAAAKAAARKEKAAKHDSPQDTSAAAVVGAADDNFEMHKNPFNAPKDEKHILKNRINVARSDGKLNIAGLDLKQIPEEVRQMYGAAAMEASNINWAELVDLTKLFAANNKLEVLEDVDFPDLSADELAADEHSEGNQFGGLELLDFHDNLLERLPMGLRRLERLTVLNVAHNKLDNGAFDVISQIKTLKDLKLGNNNLSGSLPASVCELPALEVLDLQANRLLSLPEALRDLVSLRVLNVSGNQLTALPMEALQQLPLTELDASSNALIASLFPLGGPSGHPTLQFLNVANNSLAALTFEEKLDMPRMVSLDVTNNHLTGLPPVSGWNSLFTLAVGDNKVTDLPKGFTSLMKLRNVSLTGNELRALDPEIANMEGLESLILAANPLREKRFLSMTATDIKQELRARLAPEDNGFETDEPTSPITVIGDNEVSASMWSLQGNGVLDLASKDLSDDLNTTLGSFLRSEEVKQIRLHHNRITCIPPALWMGQDLRVLDLSHNVLAADYLSDELELPALQELNLSTCKLTSLQPLVTQLMAPNLRELNICANRISGLLPALHKSFPALRTLFASDNKIRTINADSLRGLITVNLADNDIESLPAELGLLWDEGLKNLELSNNAFRVPNRQLLQKGTEATLRWLRDKLPASSVAGED
ncbi:Leucine-rich repeat-containing protein 40 [Fulvia fulva]|uniref:Leucine-rich repeat-containing protein 40 n=1 Tax=Passalora fulva TaxID=5499 RepID=A0A9Q8URR0_PASFU|nr:Leucine-rich repeat-containing protein 40 [Fulvia fulva]KAK4620887.1 Leucine-rich repeat-containing protein 40 [Fulvia fulva]UJO19977.1 Leucine-rich repeat-containing protein 40 [Fulvia fulva]